MLRIQLQYRQQALNLSNTTITTMTAAMTTIPRLNASVIINAINAKVKSIYDTNSEGSNNYKDW